MAGKQELQQIRGQVIALYKGLSYLGRQHPRGHQLFQIQLKEAFMKNRDLKDVKLIKRSIAYGNYMIKEIEALCRIRKYRTLKQRYYQ